MGKNAKLNTAVILTLLGGLVLIEPLPILGNQTQGVESDFTLEKLSDKLIIFQDNTLVPISNPPNSEIKVVKRVKVIVTAYSSTKWQTDSTPHITAAGTSVRDGICANNLLPFGTKVRFPEIYGDKIFVVEDRMHRRKGYYHVDIWFASYDEAKNFGTKRTYMEVIERVPEN